MDLFSEPEFLSSVVIISNVIEVVGVFVIIAGFIYVTIRAGRQLFDAGKVDLPGSYRRGLGQAMLLGLDFLVAGDIIRTVVVEHTLEDVLSLGLIVIIRTILVFTIHLEVEGRWPWQEK